MTIKRGGLLLFGDSVIGYVLFSALPFTGEDAELGYREEADKRTSDDELAPERPPHP